MKIIFIIGAFLLVYLFVPHYALYVAEDKFSDVYTLNQDNFFSKNKCETEGEILDIPYYCESYTAWGALIGTQRKYNNGHQID